MGDDNNIVVMFEQGGWIVYVIFSLSIIALALVIERLVWLRRIGVSDDIFHAEFLTKLEGGASTPDLIAACEGTKTVLAELFAEGLRHGTLGMLARRRVLLDFFDGEIKPRLEHNLTWISTIGKLAPMLGLFGTVYGMMGAFNTMARAATQAKPQELAGDINVALATTVAGLIVAIPAIACHSWLTHRIRRRGQEYQRRLGDVLVRLTKTDGAVHRG